MSQFFTIPGGKITRKRDVTANDSDKIFTVDADHRWQVLWIYVKLVTTATVGNRILTVLLTDSGDNVLYSQKANNLAASSTMEYLFIPGVERTTAVQSTEIYALPTQTMLDGADKIRVYDSAAIAAAADDMDVVISIIDVQLGA